MICQFHCKENNFPSLPFNLFFSLRFSFVLLQVVKALCSSKSHDISNTVSCSSTTKFLMTKTTVNIISIRLWKEMNHFLFFLMGLYFLAHSLDFTNKSHILVTVKNFGNPNQCGLTIRVIISDITDF